MNKKVLKQKELMSILKTSRESVRFLMYEKGIIAKTQYCPYSKKIKSGYLVSEDIVSASKDVISSKTSSKLNYYLLVKNNSSCNLSLIKIENTPILKSLNIYAKPIAYIETNLCDIDLFLTEKLGNYKIMLFDEFLTEINKLGIDFLHIFVK